MTQLFWKDLIGPAAVWLVVASPMAVAKDEEPTFKRYNLRCLAPLLENLDSEEPKTLEEALLAGPAGSDAPRVDDRLIGAGAVSFPIETSTPEVQEHFNRGVALLHALWYREAARSFRTVVHLEPDRAMGYWGLAMANEQRPGRARVFAKAAVDRVDANRPALERRWVAILGDYYGVPLSEGASTEVARSRERIRGLEDLVIDYPDSVEAKAFMLRQLVLDQYRAGVTITSRLGVEQLVGELAAAAPNHPSQHYGAFLWLQTRPDRGVSFAKASVTPARGVAEIWRYAAEALVGAERSAEALPFYEASVRVDQAFLSRNLLMPWETQNLAGNYEALVRTLTGMGRVEEAIEWSSALLNFPKQSVSEPNHPGTDLCELGQTLWIDALAATERWDDLEALLQSGELDKAGDGFRVSAGRLFWMGVCGIFLEDREGVEESLKGLKDLHRASMSSGVSNSVEQSISSAEKALRSCQSLFRQGGGNTLKYDADHMWINRALLTSLHVKAEMKREALVLARLEMDQNPDHVVPTAVFISLASEVGQKRDAFFRFDRRFRISSGLSDEGLPILDRLGKVAREMQLPEPWTLSQKPQPAAVDLEAMGDKYWVAPMAPDFDLQDAGGQGHTLQSMRGKPVVMNFFLGVQCGYCLEQLRVFGPHLDDFRKSGVDFVAVSSDTVEVLQERIKLLPGESYKKEGEFPFLVLADPGLEVFRRFGAFDVFEGGPLHATVLIDAEGRLVWSDRGHAPFKRPEELLIEVERLVELSKPEKSN